MYLCRYIHIISYGIFYFIIIFSSSFLKCEHYIYNIVCVVFKYKNVRSYEKLIMSNKICKIGIHHIIILICECSFLIFFFLLVSFLKDYFLKYYFIKCFSFTFYYIKRKQRKVSFFIKIKNSLII